MSVLGGLGFRVYMEVQGFEGLGLQGVAEIWG